MTKGRLRNKAISISGHRTRRSVMTNSVRMTIPARQLQITIALVQPTSPGDHSKTGANEGLRFFSRRLPSGLFTTRGQQPFHQASSLPPFWNGLLASHAPGCSRKDSSMEATVQATSQGTKDSSYRRLSQRGGCSHCGCQKETRGATWQ